MLFLLEIIYPRIPGAVPPQDFIQTALPEEILSLYAKYLVNLCVWAGGILALAGLIYGGILYLLSTGKPERMSLAKSQISAAFFGLLILFSSYLLLNTLNPQLTDLTLPKLEPVQIPVKPWVPLPEITSINSSIDIEMPFSRVIEKLFETYVSDYPSPQNPPDPRITRIETNVETTKKISQKLEKQSERLKNLTGSCSCGQAKPVCPGCQALGAQALGNFLGVDGLLQYNAITGNISDIVGAGNLGQVLEFSTNIAGSVGNISDFSSILNSMTDISRIVPLPGNLDQVFGAAGNLATISENPAQLFGSIESLASLTTVPANLTQVFDLAETGLNIIENPNDLNTIFGALGRISKKTGIKLPEVFQAVKPIGNIVQNPQDLSSIFGAIEGISNKAGSKLSEIFQATGSIKDVTKNSQDLKIIFETVKNISDKTGINLKDVFNSTGVIGEKVETTENLKNVFGSIQDISDKTGVNLKEVFKIAQEANKSAETPEDLIKILRSREDFTKLIPTKDLPDVLKNIKTIASSLKNQKDLKDIKTAIENLSEKVPLPENLTGVFGDLKDISEKVKAPTDLSNIQSSIQDLSNIGLAPNQLTDVLGNLGDISAVIKSPAKLGNLQIAVAQLSDVVSIPQDLTNILGDFSNISGVIKDPTNLGNLQPAIQNLSNVLPVPENLTSILGELQGISGIIQDPTNLNNIQSAIGQLAGVVPSLGDFTGVLGNLGGMSSIIQDPANLGNVMDSFGNLSQIVPLGELPNVLGQLNSLGNLFQSPQNIVNAFIGGSCTCDPCQNVREEIKKNQEKNKEEINNLAIEQAETEKEIRSLKEWLDRLKRAEKFINECPLRSLGSLAQFYNKKDSYDNQDWILRDANFWDDVNIRYYLSNIYGEASAITDNDFATFYCSVSGTMGQEEAFPDVPDEDKLTGQESAEEAEEIFTESMACLEEAPVGEIIDRSKRTAQHLIDKLEELIGKEKELIDAVDKLQQAVSQCTSQVPRCRSICIPLPHGRCYKKCEGSPCPRGKINKQFDEVQRIKDEIEDIINNKEQGIVFVINEVIPEILNDLETKVRRPMKAKKCGKYFFNCSQVKMAIIPPDNQVLRQCCQTENNPYGDCFQECYLEIGQDKQRECVQGCLEKTSVALNDPEIVQCVHELNFYCCP